MTYPQNQLNPIGGLTIQIGKTSMESFALTTKLSLHSVISRIEEKFKLLTDCYLDFIDENGNIIITLHETSTTIHQEFKITARRKKLRRLENIAAFNVARQLSSEADIQELQLPKTMKKIINMYLDTFSINL